MRNAISHVTVGFPRNDYMSMLGESSRRCGFNFVELPKFYSRARIFTIDKVRFLYHFLETNTLSDNDVILFTDAYDVLILEHAEVIRKNFEEFSVEIVFNAEANLFPDEDREDERAFFDKIDSKWRYLNSGAFIGYVRAIRAMLAIILKGLEGLGVGEAHSADQQLMQDFFINAELHGISVALDVDTRIFATLILSESDFSYSNGRVINNITRKCPSILHANGDKRNLKIIDSISNINNLSDFSIIENYYVIKSEHYFINFNPDLSRLELSEKLSENSVFLLRGNLVNIAFCLQFNILTFAPDLTVRHDASRVDSWEILSVGKTISTHHGALLADFFADPQPESVQICPMPLSILNDPFAPMLMGAAKNHHSMMIA